MTEEFTINLNDEGAAATGCFGQNKVLDAALAYLKVSLPIIPICSPDHRGESLKHREICSSHGKVPVILGWQTRTTTKKEEVTKWFASHPHRNIGLPTGNASKLVGIDVDGELGEKYLQELSKGDLPETWEFTTGKGRRLLYALPDGIKVKKFKQAEKGTKHEELALLGDGQQTVVPPSIHVLGHKYTWLSGRSPFDMARPAAAPEWMLDLMRKKTREIKDEELEYSPKVEGNEWTGIVPEGQRQDRLKRLAGSLLHRGTIPKEEVLNFLRIWNKAHCVPPWPDHELATLVNNLAYVEQAKSVAGKGKDGKDVLRPTIFAAKFIQDQKNAGFSWHYSIRNGCFYRCDDAIGPWEIYDKQLVSREVRKALIAEREEWDFQRFINEATEAIKEKLARPEIDDLLDLGQNAATRPSTCEYVSVANGLLNWKSLELRPWDTNSFMSVQLPIAWDPEAKCPHWDEAMKSWLPDPEVRAFLQEYVGLCLIPDTSFRTAVFLYGRGSNGKSLFIDGISLLFGSAIHFTPLHRLAERFETANLQGKLINVCGDIDPKYLADTGVIKAIVSGDKIMGEYKHGKSFYFTPVARLMFSANEIPRARDRSEGWYSRWRHVEFPVRFERDSSFKIEFEKAIMNELPGMLNWAVEGLRRLKVDNNFTDSRAIDNAMHEYVIENDNIANFISERLLWNDGLEEAILKDQVVVPKGKGIGPTGAIGAFYIDKQSLYRYYKWFCDEYNFKAVNVSEFTRQMRARGIDTGPRPPKNDPKSRTPSFLKVCIKPEHEREFNFVSNIAG